MALFRRRVSLGEALGAVREELAAGPAQARELIDLHRLLNSELGPASPEPRAQEMVDGYPDPAGVVDGAGRFLACNEKLRALLGKERCLDRTVLESTRSAELAAFVASGRALPVEAELVLPSMQLTVRASAAPLSLGRVLVVLRDLSEQKRLEGVRRDFIANASHELRTPVSAIAGAVETLLSDPVALPEDARAFAQIIARHAERLARLTSDLLDLSRLEAGQFKPELQAVEVAPFSEACLLLVRERAAQKALTLGFDGPLGVKVRADRRALEQIVVNLLENAVKFTPQGGRVTLLCDAAGPSVILSVIDTGPGVEPRHRERIFERFWRADPGRAREAGGTGLGLAIARHLALAQGGQLGVESGQGGSRFWLKLPAA